MQLEDLQQGSAMAVGAALRSRVEQVAETVARRIATQAYATHAEMVEKAVARAADQAVSREIARTTGRLEAEIAHRGQMMLRMGEDIDGIRSQLAKVDPNAASEIWQQVRAAQDRLAQEAADLIVLRKRFAEEVGDLAAAPARLREEVETVAKRLAPLERDLVDTAAEIAVRVLDGAIQDARREIAEAVDAERARLDKVLGALDPDALLPRVFRGPYDPVETYGRGDLVTWRGSTWIATSDGNTAPVAKAGGQWQMFAAGGFGSGDREAR